MTLLQNLCNDLQTRQLPHTGDHLFSWRVRIIAWQPIGWFARTESFVSGKYLICPVCQNRCCIIFASSHFIWAIKLLGTVKFLGFFFENLKKGPNFFGPPWTKNLICFQNSPQEIYMLFYASTHFIWAIKYPKIMIQIHSFLMRVQFFRP